MKRFWSKVDIRSKKECWPWKASKSHQGYGHFSDGGRKNKRQGNASRFAYIYTFGEVKKGIMVCHTCDNPSCCNPSHLFVGTQKDNMSDCAKKGRARGPYKKGDHNPHSAKTNAKSVKQIRKKYATGKFSQWDLARQYGLGQAQISVIVRKVNWNHM